MGAVVVDTDVLSYVFKGHSSAPDYAALLDGSSLLMSFMTYAELHQWAYVNGWGMRRIQRLEDFISEIVVVESNPEIDRSWARVCVECKEAGRPISPQDAWNAAVALYLAIPLVTNNASDYLGLQDLEVITIPAESDGP